MVKRSAPEGCTDEELVRLFNAGGVAGREAAAQLLERWRLPVYSWCRRFARDHDLAMDLAQDVLLSVYRSLGSFEFRAPFGAWVFTITRHRCIRAMRPVALVRDDGAEVEELHHPEQGPEETAEGRIREEQVLEAIREELEPQEQRALWLRCIERMPVDEVTRMLELDSATGARGLLQTARRKLRAALQRRGITIEEGEAT